MSDQKNLKTILSFVYALQHSAKGLTFLTQFITFKISRKRNLFARFITLKANEKNRIMTFFKRRCLLIKRLLMHCKIFRDKILEMDLHFVHVTLFKVEFKVPYYLPLTFLDQRKVRGFLCI